MVPSTYDLTGRLPRSSRLKPRLGLSPLKRGVTPQAELV